MMPAGWLERRSKRRFLRTLALASLIIAIVVSCAGPETGDDRDPTPTPTVTVTPTASSTPNPPTATASPTVENTATPEPTETRAASPEASPSTEGSPTATEVALKDRLPALAEMPGQGYTIAEDGTRTAEDLAEAYTDAAAHLRRLEDWGFKQHLYRAFTRDGADNDPLPYYILATINEYGSDEQAEEALQWLRQLGTATGAEAADAPKIGDNAVAQTVATAEGVPTASLYVRDGAVVFVYFAQGGDPLPAVTTVATNVFNR
jgi:hypothetical protein